MNNYRSLSITFRVGLAFHGLNMEGTSGNVMEPRRIALGDAEYDGISGEIVRQHILENFIDLAVGQIPLHQKCQGLDPSRGTEALTQSIPDGSWQAGRDFPAGTETLISKCAICDIGGYLIAERSLKRDSTFEVGWLISEHPSQADYTQHVAYHADQQHNLFTMGIRSAIYGGVMRFDLDRIGHNDWWWLVEDGNGNRWPVSEDGRRSRASALLTAVKQWLLSPGGARQASWLQHQGEPFEGIMVLSKDGPAPFVSPIALDVEPGSNGDLPKPRVKPNTRYRDTIKDLAGKSQDSLTTYEFGNQAEMVEGFKQIFEELKIGKAT
jgi:CRISPR-associated autoregulator DevR family